jgi:hypothetical protein
VKVYCFVLKGNLYRVILVKFPILLK